MRRLTAVLVIAVALSVGFVPHQSEAAPKKTAAPEKEEIVPYDRATDVREQVPLFPAAGAADGPIEPAATTDLPTFNFGMFLLNVAVWLVVCIGLIYALVSVLKLVYKRFPGGSQTPMLETLASVAVAPGVAIHLVRMHDTILILGATSGSVTLIEKVTDPDRVALLVQGFTPKPLTPNPRSFGEVLARTQRQLARGGSTNATLENAVARAELGHTTPEPRVWVIGDPPELPMPPEIRESKIEALRNAIRDLQGPAEQSG